MTQNAEQPLLILASASPRRKELLERISFPFRIIDSGVEEEISNGHSAVAAVSILARRKAAAVAAMISEGIVLAADTVIDFRGKILGKPENSAHAVEMLRLLRGHPHAVITGMTALNKHKAISIVSAVVTEVKMRAYDDQEIIEYVETGEPLDKAGSYAIQGEGSRLIESTCGCYNNVIGLPLCETIELLKCVGMPLVEERGLCRLPSGEFCPRER